MLNERTFQIETEQQRTHLSGFVSRQPVPFQATVGPLRERRSIGQNARLWALHSLASQHTGYSAEEMHEFALCRHFGYVEQERTDLLTGEIGNKRVPKKRSSARDKKEFAEFMEATEAWYGTELGVWL